LCSKSSNLIEVKVETRESEAQIYAKSQSRIAHPLWFESMMVLENVRVQAFLYALGGAVFSENVEANVGQEILVQLVQLGQV
jgi:hypothetical protein